MYIKDMMTSRIVTVEMDDTLGEVREVFDNVSSHHVMVVEDNGELIGIISDRDMRHNLSPKLDTAAELQRDRDTLTLKVHQVMTRNVITLGPDDQVFDAIAHFTQHKISALPVVDGAGKPVGIVSWRDILQIIVDTKSREDFNAWI